MMLLLALATGAAALFNCYALTTFIYPLFLATILQVDLCVLTSFALVAYKERRSRLGYDTYKPWTLSYTVIIISLIGNFFILIIFILNMADYLSGF